MRGLLILAGAVVVLGVVPGAQAQSSDRWGLDFGWFASSFNSQLRLDSEEAGTGTTIDMEDDLGLDSNRGDFRFQGYYRFNPRHRIQLGYTRWKRTAERVIDREIQWGDQIYEVDARVATDLQSDWYKLAYKYSFVNNDSVEWARPSASAPTISRPRWRPRGASRAVGPASGRPSPRVSSLRSRWSA